MPNEFSIGGSFSTDPGYNPFGGGFGALASSAAGASGSLNPAVTTTSASSTASSSSSSSSSGGSSGWGGMFQNILDTGLGWVDGILKLDIFGRAQDQVYGSGTTPATGSSGTGTNTATASGLPSWVIPAGIGAAVLIVVLLLMSSK